jgi:acyl-CoA thioester hydrolase
MDTDAAGIWHHSTIVRWAEEAEAELHRQAGVIEETFGATPRVHVEFDFHRPLRFDDLVELTLTVADLGTSSITYRILLTAEGEEIATGEMVAVLIDRQSGEKRPWPATLRSALLRGEPSPH